LPQYPNTLIYDRKVPSLDFKLCSGGLEELRTYSGGNIELKLDIPGFNVKENPKAEFEVLGPNTIRSSCRMEEKNKRLTVQNKIEIPNNAEYGQFPINVLLKNGNAVFGVLRNYLTISHPLNVVVTSCATSGNSVSGLSVGLENYSDKPLSGKAVFLQQVFDKRNASGKCGKRFFSRSQG
jgi:hypothetical protein